MDSSFLTANRTNRKSKYTYLFIGTILLIIALFTVYAIRDAKVILSKDKVDIQGEYGIQIKYLDISQIDTVKYLPSIEMKTNGYSVLTYRKGYFVLKDIGVAKLFVNYKFPPIIQIRLKDNEFIYINYSDPKKTIDLYKGLHGKINSMKGL